MLNDQLLEQILERIPNLRIGVLGDLFLDRYLDIDAELDEPSLETGLTAYQVVRVRSQPGAAGTVINNLVALGVGTIIPIAVIGDDGEGYELRQALQQTASISLSFLTSRSDRRTPTYAKPMRLELGQPAQELNRLDIKNRTPTPADAEQEILRHLEEIWPQVDALIVLDQVSEENCGVVTAQVRQRLAALGGADPERFVLADSRERIGEFENVCLKPNQRECLRLEGARLSYGHLSQEEREEIAATLVQGGRLDRAVADLARRKGRAVFCTCGEYGMFVAQPGKAAVLVSAYAVYGPIDPVGAGDSVSAGIACAAAAGANLVESAQFGNLIASITIRQLGTTGTASPAEVRSRWREVRPR
ncbi:MAG TPA: PfkB family carbohydrate kinase [Gemmataceae bacterium]|jgi:rfaE bifunctional protein kinase chain/domain|nr:PfkB family carbohydrate kinase [Gemmataceae bacterium]